MSEEVARFDALGDTWWDLDGPMAPLHRVNPIRIGWARDLIARHFKHEAGGGAPLAGIDFLATGWGGGGAARPRLLISATGGGGLDFPPSRWRGWAPMSSAWIRRRPRSRPPA